MDDRRDPPPQPGSRTPTGALSPVQQAQRARADHAKHCKQCADIDRQLCAEGELLWQAWNQTLDDAYRRLHPGRP